jgi:hypothetical protein
MMCSVTGVAFGPVLDTYEEVEAFQTWVRRTFNMDPREYDGSGNWLQARDQWLKEGRPFYDAENDEAKAER